MAENKTAKQAEKAIRELYGATREFTEQGASFAREVSDKAKTAAKETNKVAGEVSSPISSGAVEFNQEWLAMVRANTNAAFDFAHEVLEAKSPSAVIELSAEHARNQFKALIEQTQQLASLAQKLTISAAAPMQAGMKGFFDKTA